MRFKSFMPVFIFVAVASLANASLLSWNCTDDQDGGIVMGSPSALLYDSTNDLYNVSIGGVQNFGPAHVTGDFIASDELDPRVIMQQGVTNDTGFSWTGYEYYIGMNKSFTINGAYVAIPSGWSYVITQPLENQALPGDISSGTGWVGKIVFTGGAPVNVDDLFLFGLDVSFAGSVAFYTAQTPTPEPATLSILGLGILALLRKRS